MKVHSKISCGCDHNNQCIDCIIKQTLSDFLSTIYNKYIGKNKGRGKTKFVEKVNHSILYVLISYDHPSGFLSLHWFMSLFIEKRHEHNSCQSPRGFNMALLENKSKKEYLCLTFFEKVFLKMYSRDEIDDFLEPIGKLMHVNIRNLNNPFIFINQQYYRFLTREKQILKFQLVMKLTGTIQKDIVKKILVSVYPEWQLNLSTQECKNLSN